jgi:hypothetical protein
LEKIYTKYPRYDEDRIGKHQIYLIKQADGLYNDGRIREIMMQPN